MSHQILTVKLCELEKRIAKMQSRIQMSESSSFQKIQTEAEILWKEYTENELALRNKLQHSKSKVVSVLSSAYNEIEPIIRRAQETIKLETTDDADGEISTENKLLLAEYELDFSMLAIDRALLASLEAIAMQLANLKEEA